MSLILFLMSLGSMSHVDFKKSPCHHVEFRGQWPCRSHHIATRPCATSGWVNLPRDEPPSPPPLLPLSSPSLIPSITEPLFDQYIYPGTDYTKSILGLTPVKYSLPFSALPLNHFLSHLKSQIKEKDFVWRDLLSYRCLWYERECVSIMGFGGL